MHGEGENRFDTRAIAVTPLLGLHNCKERGNGHLIGTSRARIHRVARVRQRSYCASRSQELKVAAHTYYRGNRARIDRGGCPCLFHSIALGLIFFQR